MRRLRGPGKAQIPAEVVGTSAEVAGTSAEALGMPAEGSVFSVYAVGGWQIGHQRVVRPPTVAVESGVPCFGQMPLAVQRW